MQKSAKLQSARARTNIRVFEGEGERVCGKVREFESARVRDENSRVPGRARVRGRGGESARERTRIRQCQG